MRLLTFFLMLLIFGCLFFFSFFLVFLMLFDVAGRFLVGFGGVSADVAGVLVAAVG